MLTYLHIQLNAHLARMDERGATAVEYGLILAAVAVGCIIAAKAMGLVLGELFKQTHEQVTDP